MSTTTKIEWCDATWSPLRVRVKNDAGAIAAAKGYTSLIKIGERMAGHVGQHCEHVSEGCENCYSETEQHRCLPNNGTGLPFDRRSRDLVEPFVDKKVLIQPLRWKTPKKIFVENQSDLFGEWYTDEMIDRVVAVATLCQHTFQYLTKRPARMLKYFSNDGLQDRLTEIYDKEGWQVMLPLSNVWLGVSVEDQATADERIPLLLQTPAAVRFVSYEPALGPVDFTSIPLCMDDTEPSSEQIAASNPMACHYIRHGAPGIDWLIAGGESGPKARPAHPQWFRDARDQCQAAGVAFFFKQWGEWVPWAEGMRDTSHGKLPPVKDGMARDGKKVAGRLLDGREWNYFPAVKK